MPVEDANQEISLAAPPERQDQGLGEKRERGPRRKVPDRLLWVATALLVAVAAWLFAQYPRAHRPLPERELEGLRLGGFSEVQDDKGDWVVRGTVTAGPCDVAVAQWALEYVDAQDNVLTRALLDVRDMKAGEVRDFELPVPGFEAGLTRKVSPVHFARPGD